MEVGKLNARIVIQSRSTGVDAAGQPNLTWTDTATVWAYILGATGMKTIGHSGDVPAAIKQYSFRIRFREGFNESMRVVYASQNFDILQVRMDYEKKDWTDLVCELGAADG